MEYIENRKFEGLFIPRNVWFDDQLSLMEKVFLVEINSLDNDKKRGCYASNKYFSGFFGVSPTRCSQIISALKAYDLITMSYVYSGKEIKERNIHMTDRGIKYFKGGIKNILKRENNINTISKDIDKGSEEPPAKVSKYLEHWNNIPITRKHKNPSSKVYKNTIKMINRLRKGTFHKYYHIPKTEKECVKLAKKEWSEAEILKAFDNLSNYFVEGYWPSDKDKIPKDLPSLIYNPRTERSWMFKAVIEPPKLLSEKIKVVYRDEKFLDQCLELIGGKAGDRKRNSMAMMVNELVEEIGSVLKSVGGYYAHTSFSSFLGTEKKPSIFYKFYLTFLDKKYNNIKAYHFKTGGFAWEDFVVWVESEHNYILYPDNRQKNVLEKEMRRVGK